MSEDAQRNGRLLINRIVEEQEKGNDVEVMIQGVPEPFKVREATHYNGVAKLRGYFRVYYTGLESITTIIVEEPLDLNLDPGDFRLPVNGVDFAK